MWVSGCGYNWCHDSSFKAERPDGAGGNILMIIRSPARITLNKKVYYTKGNCVVIYRQHSPHIYAAHNAPFVNDWVRFLLDEDEVTFWNGLGLQLDSIVELQDVHDLSHLVQLMAVESRSANKNTVESMSYLLRLIFLKLSDYAYKKPITYNQLNKKLMELRNEIYRTPQNNWSIDLICKSMNISPSHLQHKYKQLFGNSIKSDITSSRLEYAKYLLANTNHTITAIAYMSGYETDVHFMYIFKKKMGLTPSQYRNSAVSYME